MKSCNGSDHIYYNHPVSIQSKKSLCETNESPTVLISEITKVKIHPISLSLQQSHEGLS